MEKARDTARDFENLGEQAGDWNASISQTGLKVSPSSGTIPEGEKATISVFPSPDFETLPDGLHTFELTLEDESNAGSTPVVRWLPIELRVEKALRVEAAVEDHALVLILDGPANTPYLIETSIDLETWTRFSTIQTSNMGAAIFRSEEALTSKHAYFRFVSTDAH